MAEPAALVHGLAVTGASVVRALRRHGYDVTVTDDRIDDAKRELATTLGVELARRARRLDRAARSPSSSCRRRRASPRRTR